MKVWSPITPPPSLRGGRGYGRPLLQEWLLPDLRTITNNCVKLERILFSSVVSVLAFRPGVLGSNPVQVLYLCHAFIHLFICYGLCS